MRNVEIKARCNNHEKIRKLIADKQGKFVGTDFQTDTYFKVPKGRLKLREGNIENTLIHYSRDNQTDAKLSSVSLFHTISGSDLKIVLQNALDIMVEVKKKREIYFIDNVKIHLDELENLGTFVEIEVIDKNETVEMNQLQKTCNYYIELFEIKYDDYIAHSYSDMLISANQPKQ